MAEPLLITLEEVLELMKQISWEIRKRVLESPGFSVNFFCGNLIFSAATPNKLAPSVPNTIRNPPLCPFVSFSIA